MDEQHVFRFTFFCRFVFCGRIGTPPEALAAQNDNWVNSGELAERATALFRLASDDAAASRHWEICMCRLWQLNDASKSVVCKSMRIGALMAAMLLTLASTAEALVIATGDPANGYMGVSNETPSVFTIDPFADPVTARANRGITQDRRLRQTFKNPEAFNVGEIIISFDVTAAPQVGLGLRFYEVDDVNGAWNPGTLLKEITYTSTLPGSSQILSFQLTGGDVFNLPARFSGTTGYAIEISTPFASPTDGNPGVLFFSNDGTDHYPDGRYYTETGSNTAARDIGLALIASAQAACDPGDVNCIGGVDLDDLAIIAANFRKSGSREQGDLTGDGFVDFADFDEWKRHYPGAFTGAAAAAFFRALNGNVPEPTSGMLAAMGLMGLAAFRSRQRKGNSATRGDGPSR